VTSHDTFTETRSFGVLGLPLNYNCW